MENSLYWVSAITYALVLAIILLNEFAIIKHPKKMEKSFRLMLIWVIYFCIQDAIWGLCSCGVIKGDAFFFLSSSVFHISTVCTTFFWLNFVLIYLGDRIQKRRFFLLLDGFVILAEVILVITNIFTPTLFRIEDGKYITETFRPLAFMNQYMVYFVIGLMAVIFGIKEEREERERFLTVFAFALAPIALGVFQFLYPYGPFYSMGYFLGCFIVHIFIVSKEREEAVKSNVMKSIASTYYSMHLIDLETDTMERLIEPELLERLIGDIQSAQEMVNRAFGGTVGDEYLSLILDFVDLSDISERLKDTNSISCEFIGRNYGWTRVSIISVEKRAGLQKKVMLVTQIIDTEKRKQIDLLFKSNNDELTGLSNRRAFDGDMFELKTLKEDLIFVSVDINGLKKVNDEHGHAAGDELIIGAANCLKLCFSTYGKVYRIGGDEFIAIIYATEKQLEDLKKDFEQTISSWTGSTGEKLSVSCGYVRRNEVENATIRELSVLADERMYENKNNYYKAHGINRGGYGDIQTALCELYTKILKINLTEDSFQIISMEEEEKSGDRGFSNRISCWLEDFGKRGQVHKDDLAHYLEQTNIDYLRNYFINSDRSLSIIYRRKIGDEYKKVMMEIIPANDFSVANQSLYLYVKNIDIC